MPTTVTNESARINLRTSADAKVPPLRAARAHIPCIAAFILSGQWPDVMMAHQFDKRGCHVHCESFQK